MGAGSADLLRFVITMLAKTRRPKDKGARVGTTEPKPITHLTVLLNFFDELRRRVPNNQ
jgi:hypothetical protein